MTSLPVFFWHFFVFLVKFSYWSKFHVNVFTGSGVMTVSFERDWPEIQKSEIPPSEFWPISGDYGKLWIPSLVQMSLIKYYWMLLTARATDFTVSEVLRENQQEEGKITQPLPSRLGLNSFSTESWWSQHICKTHTNIRLDLVYSS